MTFSERAFLCGFGAILAWQILLPPAAGLANNGDFSKVSGVFDLAAPADDEFVFASTRYTFDPRNHYWAGFYSPEIPLAAIAVGLSRLVSGGATFDIRFMGMVHGVLYVLAFALAAPLIRGYGRYARSVLALAAVLIFGDAMYATMLNTFYMDAGAMAFLMLGLVFLARAAVWRRLGDWAGMLACFVLLETSKAQHALLAAPVVLLLLFGGRFLVTTRRAWMHPAAAMAVLAAGAFSFFLTPPGYAPKALYSVVFYEVLRHSPNVDADMAELGLDDSYRSRIGTHGYSPGVDLDDPEVSRRFQARTSYARLGWFFARHPARTLQTILVSLDVAGRQRPWMGNLDRSAGQPPRTESQRFSLWSSWKRSGFEQRGRVYFAYFLLLVGGNAWLLAVFRKRIAPGLIAANLLVMAMAAVELLVCSLGDAVEIIRHFFLFHALLDVLFLAALGLVTQAFLPVSAERSYPRAI